MSPGIGVRPLFDPIASVQHAASCPTIKPSDAVDRDDPTPIGPALVPEQAASVSIANALIGMVQS